jgi:hypothetical protein
MTIKNAMTAHEVVTARLQSYIAVVKRELPTDTLEFWERIEPEVPIAKT